MSTPIPPSGQWQPAKLSALYYGSGSLAKNLKSCLPSGNSKAFLITTNSLSSSTALETIKSTLGSQLAGTFSKIRAHAPVEDLDKATEAATEDSNVDTIISLGGGSPIDSSKAISYRLHEKSGRWLFHIAIPTTLSAAECTHMAGYTEKNGVKTGVGAKKCTPSVIIYDADVIAGSTPQKLWLSTGLRALDHAVELTYHANTPAAPTRAIVRQAVKDLFEFLPKSKASPEDKDVITALQLAAFQSLYPFGYGMKGGIGLSHSLGYALGSPYGIPHGITSCLTLGKVVKLRAQDSKTAALLAELKPIVGKGERSGDDEADARAVGDAIEELVEGLGLKTSLEEYKVGKDQLDIIVERATGGDKGDLAKAVKGLVDTLWKDGASGGKL